MKNKKRFSKIFHVAALLAVMSASTSFAGEIRSSDVVVDQNSKALTHSEAISEQKSNVSEITKTQSKFEQVREPRI